MTAIIVHPPLWQAIPFERFKLAFQLDQFRVLLLQAALRAA